MTQTRSEAIATARKLRKDLEHIGSLPSPEVDNVRKATSEQLVDEFIRLRLFVGQMLMEQKKLYAILDSVLESITQEDTTTHG